MNIKNFLDNHISFNINIPAIISIIFAAIIVPSVMFLPNKFGYENGLFENLQLITLLTGFIIALKSKVNKKFFIFAALVIGILFFREINCGRTLFFAVPGTVNTFYHWSEIPYGYLAHPIYGVYIALTVIYFLWNKLYIKLWNIIKSVPFPVWNIILMILGMTLGMYAEKCLENMLLEETSELLFYVSLAGIIYLYTNNAKFNKEI